MQSSRHGEYQKSLEIKQDDKFFTRIMSKETSIANSSCRVYYGGASGAIPFTWETRPGTPKHTLAETSIPPLTPPPSYYSSSKSKSKSMSKTVRSNILTSIFPRLTSRKAHVSPSSSSASSSSSSWSSSFCSSSSTSTNSKFQKRRCFSSSRSPITYTMDNDEEDYHDEDDSLGSPNLTLCYGVKHKALEGFRDCHLMGSMKNAFLSIAKHGSA